MSEKCDCKETSCSKLFSELFISLVSYIAAAITVVGMFRLFGLTSSDGDELIKRGLKQYNSQTGKLEWTEKAGGEEFEKVEKD